MIKIHRRALQRRLQQDQHLSATEAAHAASSGRRWLILTTEADHNRTRPGLIPADGSVTASPAQRSFPTASAYL